MRHEPQYIFLWLAMLGCAQILHAQEVLETGGRKMPDEWIDKDTGHRIIRLSDQEVSSTSFYFHNRPFIGNKMVFYGTSKQGKQLFTVDLGTSKIEQITRRPGSKKGEIAAPGLREVFYQVKDSVFAAHIDTKEERLVFVFPAEFKGDVTTVNADATLLGGVYATGDEKEIFRQNPDKGDYFNKIYEARLPRTLFTIDLNTGELEKIFTDSAWLNHVQFSSTDPTLLMYCHEGPWHKVDRIWTIDVNTEETMLRHKRTMDMEIAGHEWFSPDGNTIWFDLQLPRGETFFLAGVDVHTGKTRKYQLERNEWSVHYTLSPDQKKFAGDGGDPGSVARSSEGQWIYLFTPQGGRFESGKLVNMQHHQYKLEPNVHFSPDGKWVIFRANFEGNDQVYAVEIETAK